MPSDVKTVKFSAGDVICKAGDPISHISLITEGEVAASSQWHVMKLTKTDVLGLGDLASGTYTYTCTASTNVTLGQYSCNTIDALSELVRSNADVSFLMLVSLCKYMSAVFEHLATVKREIEAVPALIDELFEEYTRLCKLYDKTPGALPVFSDAPELPAEDAVPEWLSGYYLGISTVSPDVRKAFYRGSPGIINGFLHSCVKDIPAISEQCAAYHNYLCSVAKPLYNSENTGLFSLISKLHIATSDNEGADFAIDTLIVSLDEHLEKLSDLNVISREHYNKCLSEYRDTLEDSRQGPSDILDVLDDDLFASAVVDTQGSVDSLFETLDSQSAVDTALEAPDTQDSAGSALETIDTQAWESAFDDSEEMDIPTPSVQAETDSGDVALNPKLTESLAEILKYSGADKDFAAEFTSSVCAYRDLADRNSPDDEVYDLRRNLTKSFYTLYKLVLNRSFSDKSPPTVVNMFLNFGYVDAGLAGYANANYLFEIADSYKGDPANNIFTMREWLASILKGERDPSLSEFDMDYTAYIRDLKNSKQINPADEKKMLADQEAKLNYELDNAFPVVNRVTFGNPSKFCPVFSSHNIVRNLKDALVTPAAIVDFINEIRRIDFSAFYRETSFSDNKVGGLSEHINVEVLPNIILTPTVGLRGSMWQDVEGRIRTTPARMFMPTFLENDLPPLILKLVAEFRWEICRRIQGTRWNDMTDPSLTSYFCDYLQFYMNNKNIAMQTMNEIRQELSAARNNYKTVFVKNYAMWILNESRGMSRLNSIALGILMTFCPFSADIREKLKLNMRFREALNRYNVRQQKRVTHFSNLIKKLQQNGKPVPPEIQAELEFWYK